MRIDINRDDFWAGTSKCGPHGLSLNFLQQISTILKQHGRAAVVLPDNVLFEGGAGDTIFRQLLQQADVHIREMLGSMTHFGVTRGAIYTLKGWTDPAGAFARQHQISLADASELAQRAKALLPSDRLDELLTSRRHHCPKCEAEMVWRDGNFTPFWGCSKYPRCRGKLNHSGAR